jgi:hypothetical protein
MDEGSKKIGTLHVPVQIAAGQKPPAATDKQN